jgi:branched-subunit amino acid ABC-type transport system permease component
VLQSIIEGLAYGGLYTLLGLGFHLTYGVMRRIDLSYGTVVMASVYLAAMLANSIGLPWYALLPLSIAIGVPLALLVAWIAFLLVRGDARFSMAATLGIWMAIEELLLQSPTRGRGQPIDNPASQTLISAFGLDVRLDHLLLFALGLACAWGLRRLLTSSQIGLAIRVSAFDASTAGLMGMSHRRTMLAATALAAMIGSCAGWAFGASQAGMDLHFGMWATLKGLVILALAGSGSITAVAVAGLTLGVGERLATELAGDGYRNLLVFALMFAMLAARAFVPDKEQGAKSA